VRCMQFNVVFVKPSPAECAKCCLAAGLGLGLSLLQACLAYIVNLVTYVGGTPSASYRFTSVINDYVLLYRLPVLHTVLLRLHTERRSTSYS